MATDEYYNFVAEQLLDIDIERLDSAIRNLTGLGVDAYMQLRVEATEKKQLKKKTAACFRGHKY